MGKTLAANQKQAAGKGGIAYRTASGDTLPDLLFLLQLANPSLCCLRIDLQHHPQATPAEVKAALQHTAVAKAQHEAQDAPQLLLDMPSVSSRLRRAKAAWRAPMGAQ